MSVPVGDFLHTMRHCLQSLLTWCYKMIRPYPVLGGIGPLRVSLRDIYNTGSLHFKVGLYNLPL